MIQFFEFLKREPIHKLWLLYAFVGIALGPMKTKVIDNSIVISAIIVMTSSLYSLLIVMLDTKTGRDLNTCRIAFLLMGIIILLLSIFCCNIIEWHLIVNIIVTLIIVFYSFLCYLLQFIDKDFKTKTDKDVKKNINNKTINNKVFIGDKEINL